MKYEATIGKEIVEKSKSPFVDDETLARWIDYAINNASSEAKIAEQIRIEKQIAKMTQDELLAAKNQCEFLNGSKDE